MKNEIKLDINKVISPLALKVKVKGVSRFKIRTKITYFLLRIVGMVCPVDTKLEIEMLDKEKKNLNSLYPDKCPITQRPFFMTIEHPEKGIVPTYGGPFDSYTIPEMYGHPEQPWHERELCYERYDHDEGCWTDELTISTLRIVDENYLFEAEDKVKNMMGTLKEFLAYYEADENLSWGSLSQDARAIIAKVEGVE
jgi:hypothetical protein